MVTKHEIRVAQECIECAKDFEGVVRDLSALLFDLWRCGVIFGSWDSNSNEATCLQNEVVKACDIIASVIDNATKEADSLKNDAQKIINEAKHI